MSSLGKFPGYLGRECHPEPGATLERPRQHAAKMSGSGRCGRRRSLAACVPPAAPLGVLAGRSGRFHHSIEMQSASATPLCRRQLDGDYLPRFRGSQEKKRKCPSACGVDADAFARVSGHVQSILPRCYRHSCHPVTLCLLLGRVMVRNGLSSVLVLSGS